MAQYVIGDIHGCLNALTGILSEVPLKENDSIIFLGDYIDRGPDSAGVIETILRLAKEYKVIALRGNHEVMMLDAVKRPYTLEHWLIFGGDMTLKSYRVLSDNWHKEIPARHWQFVKNTLPFFESGNKIFVHAGLLNGYPLSDQPDMYLYWEHQFEPESYADDKIVFCGHSPQKDGKIRRYKNTVFVDTYAYGGKFLSCLNADTGEFWQCSESGGKNKGAMDLSI